MNIQNNSWCMCMVVISPLVVCNFPAKSSRPQCVTLSTGDNHKSPLCGLHILRLPIGTPAVWHHRNKIINHNSPGNNIRPHLPNGMHGTFNEPKQETQTETEAIMLFRPYFTAGSSHFLFPFDIEMKSQSKIGYLKSSAKSRPVWL